MSFDNGALDPELQALLERDRLIPEIPDVLRARVLARARSTMAAGGFGLSLARPTPAPTGWLRFAVAAGAAMIVGVASAATVLHWRAAHRAREAAEDAPSILVPAGHVSLDVPPAVEAPANVFSQPVRARPGHSATAAPQDSYAAEIELIQRAQGAFASENFAEALALTAKHNRRFPNGRLAEEREGLRVRALVGAGQRDEARHAVASFAHRFPRSVLLPRLRDLMKSRD